MNLLTLLTHGLQAAAIGHLGIALLNFFLPTMLRWHDDLAKLPTLIREVFHVHAWFISVTVFLFGVLTWRFAPELARGDTEIGLWLSTGIGLFWGIRFLIQWIYYSWSHWRGNAPQSIAHFILTFVYLGWAIAYLACGRIH